MRRFVPIFAAALACAAGCCTRNDLVGAEGLVATPPALDFGRVAVGAQLAKSLSIANQGAAPIELRSAGVAENDPGGGPLQFSAAAFAPATLAPGQSVTLSIAFAPLSGGLHYGTLTLTTDATTSPTATVSLSGEGVVEPNPPDAGADAGTPDSGSPPPPDSGTPANPVGCADGTREGFADQTTYPDIAACSGAWSVPGLFGVPPACGNQGGNDGPHADGQGCAAVDLCAPGWHVCLGSQELLADTNGSGCSSGLPAVTSGPGLFFAVAQNSCNDSVCDAAGASCSVGPNENDFFGCPAPGSHLGFQPPAGNGCGPLWTIANTQAGNACGWAQAGPPNGPWECPGTTSYDEGQVVTKDGCQGNSCCTSNNCYNNGAPLGPSDEGGVLCCKG